MEISLKIKDVVFPGDSVVKNPLANIGDMSSIPNLRGFQCGGAAKPELHAIDPELRANCFFMPPGCFPPKFFVSVSMATKNPAALYFLGILDGVGAWGMGNRRRSS